MRFKQALSRKLAAALSAVMILSTIAPTSVPVLAAAPDDVLVDSNVEYDLQDAGSEVLTDSVESSLAEESVAPEVAEEELLVDEAVLAEDTLVDAAEVAETGAEPVEANDGVEVAEGAAPEGFYEIRIPVAVSNNIIESIQLVSWNEATGQTTTTYSEWPITAVVSENSVVSINRVTLIGDPVKWNEDDFVLKFKGNTISANTDDIDVLLVDGITSDIEVQNNADTGLNIVNNTYNGNVKYSVTSGNVIKHLAFEIVRAGAINEVEHVTVDETIENENLSLVNARSITLKFDKDADLNRYSDKYKIVVNGDVVSKDNIDSYTKVLSGNQYSQGFNITAERTAYDGKATINIVSNNLINGVKYEVDGVTGTADIREDKAEFAYTNANKLTITGFNYTFDKKGVDVTIEGSKFEAGDAPTKLPKFDITGSTLVLNNVGNKAEKNTRTVDFTLNITSENSISSFTYKLAKPSYPSGSTGEVTVNVSNNKLEIKGIEEAKSIKIYNIVASKAGNAQDVADAQGALKITYGGKTEYVYTGKSFADGYEIKFTKNTEEATLEFVPYKEITLSGNEFSDVSGYYFLNGGAYDGAWDYIGFGVNGTQKVYVEPGVMTLSVSNIEVDDADYYFPKVENGSNELRPKYQSASPSSYYDLGKFDADATVKIGVKAYIVDDTEKSAIKATVAPGKAAITYASSILHSGKVTEKKLGLSDNTVLLNTTIGNMIMNFAPENKDPKYTYRVGRVDYKFFAGETMMNGDPIVENKVDGLSNTDKSPYITMENVVKTLLANDEFDVTVTQVDAVNKYTLALSDPDSAVKDATAADNGIYIAGINHGNLAPSTQVFYGTKLKFKGELKPGFTLKSVSFNYAILSENGTDKIQQSDTVEADKFNKAKDGYEFEMKGVLKDKSGEQGLTVVFNVEKDYAANVEYVEGSDKTVAIKSGKYQVNHQRKVKIQYKSGNAIQTDFNYKAVAGKDSIESIIVKKTDGTLELDPKDLAGKTVTITLYAKDGKGDKTDKSVRTVTLVIDKADSGVTFASDTVTAQLGTTKQFKATVKGNVEAVAKLTKGTGAVVAFKNGAVEFTTVRSDAKGDYEVDIVDAGNNTIKYATLKIKVDANEVEKAESTVKITGVSNQFVTVSLAPSKVDTKIDGLAYKVEIKVSGQTKSLYEDKTVYLPITTKAYSVEMFTAAAKADPAKKYMGDEKAEFTATATVVQLNVADAAFGTATKANEVGVGKASKEAKAFGKAGEIFETKLRLKKAAGMSKVYTNMASEADAGNLLHGYLVNAHPFMIDVVYNKNTGVQQFDPAKTELTGADGTIYNAANYIDYPDGGFYQIAFHPVEKGSATTHLDPGNYTIKVYALEPEGYEVSATIKVKVLQAIEKLSIEGTPKFIYKQANKKATVDLAAYDTTDTPMKRTKKVKWSIEDVENTATPISKFVGKGMVQIAKNGRITIDKNFKPEGILSFNVVAQANDYQNNGGNTVKAAAQTIYIKSSAFSPDIKLAFGTATGDFDNTPKDLGSSYTVSELFFYEGSAADKGYKYATFVSAYEKSKETGDVDYIPCKYSVTGAKLLDTRVVQNGDYTVTYAVIGFNKPGDVKISATATDNSGRALKGKNAKVVKVLSSIKDKGGKLGFWLWKDATGIAWRTDGDADEKDIPAGKISQNVVPEGDYMSLMLTGYYKDATGAYDNDFATTNVTAKGAKVVKTYKYGNDSYEIYPTAETTILTIKNSDAKKRDFKITIKNETIKKTGNTTVTTEKKDYAKGGKTVIANKSASIYSSIDFTNVGEFNAYNKVSVNNVKFTVSPGKKDDYALVTVLPNKKGTIENAVAHYGTLVEGTTYAFKLKEGGVFNIDFNYDGATEGKFSVKPGTYSLNVTPASKNKSGDYVATGKTVKVNIKAAKAPKAKVKPKANVTFTVSSGQIEKGTVKNIIPKDFGKKTQVDYEFITNRNPAVGETLKGANNKGTINNFFNYFEVDTAGKLTFVGNKHKASLKNELNPKDKADKLELVGYAPYTYQNLDGTVSTVYIKVNIKAKDNLKKK